MDGDGSIQVNHWREQYLQYRLVIKLKNTPANKAMLQLIVDHLGGSCNEVSRGFVVWTENTASKVAKLLTVFDKYPLLTTRMRYQIQFLRSMNELASQKGDRASLMETYFTQRALKYSERATAASREAGWFINQPHFKEWLSGFIEAEGCFCVRSRKKKSSFSINQSYDQDLLKAIQSYLATAATVRLRRGAASFYYLETYKRSSLLQIIEHCRQYPLLGEKNIQFQRFATFVLSQEPGGNN